jgi:hypothetical protein
MDCPTTDLRRLIGTSAHTLRRKYLPNTEVVGALRVILADNNGGIFADTREDLEGDDLEAVASKFLHVTVGQEPVDFLASLGGRAATNAWVSGDRIAAHARWLAENRAVTPGNRFLVEGSATSMTHQLIIGGRFTSLVCEWLAGFLERPTPFIFQQGTAIVGTGRVLVSAEAISSHWSQYISSASHPPSKTKIGTALRKMSLGLVRPGAGRRYHDVRPDLVLDWMRSNGVGDLDAVAARVDGPLAPAGAAI